MTTRDDIPLGEPEMRIWELNETSSRYDRLVAAPSDETLVLIWSIWSGIFLLISIFIIVVFLGIVTSPKARATSFNVYVALLTIPDIVFTFSCVITCFMNAMAGRYYSAAMCRFQAWYVVFGVAGSAWMNALIAWEVSTMLQKSHNRERYYPPNIRQVLFRSMVVFFYSASLSVFGIFEIKWLPYKTRVQNGMVCAPMEYDVASAVFFFAVSMPLMLAIPMGYILYASYRIMKMGWMPPRGRRRALAVYFFRIDIVFLIMWTPALICFYVWISTKPWVVFGASIWGHGQGVMSAGLALLKEDIRCAVKAFVMCRTDTGPPPQRKRSAVRSSSTQVSGLFVTGISPSSADLSRDFHDPCSSNLLLSNLKGGGLRENDLEQADQREGTTAPDQPLPVMEDASDADSSQRNNSCASGEATYSGQLVGGSSFDGADMA